MACDHIDVSGSKRGNWQFSQTITSLTDAVDNWPDNIPLSNVPSQVLVGGLSEKCLVTTGSSVSGHFFSRTTMHGNGEDNV